MIYAAAIQRAGTKFILIPIIYSSLGLLIIII
jgi:hypothetical protein